ncbi:MAG TPA: glycoside hydrolase family 15 protein [Acidiferrobacter sp.]|nr:glycoside hydrolase family 15 protein [Acidiferrobacter sp.]
MPQSDHIAIENYALIGNAVTGALVGNNGSIDWFCAPRIDSCACFAALLGDRDNGHWQIAPHGRITATTRRYRETTLVLETDFETDQGSVRVIDFMPISDDTERDGCHVIRIVEGLRGTVDMRMRLVIRFYYGSMVPWVRHIDGAHMAVAGPDTLYLATSVSAHREDQMIGARFLVAAGQREVFHLTYQQTHQTQYTAPDPHKALVETERWWRDWADQCTYRGPWRDAVMRSLITLKALSSRPTGAIAAALTTSLPEKLGGTRNWDYRYCWVRDATFTLWALLTSGYTDEATAWREWLLRAVAGSPEDLQIVYGVAGERWLGEREIPWLHGYENSTPVRVGNAASDQFQLDVYGELMDSLHFARSVGLHPEPHAWNIQLVIMEFLETRWQLPDDGIWEVREGRQHFTHSKVMAWVAFDRAVKDATRYQLKGPIERWAQMRDAIHEDICQRGFSKVKNSFTQHYGTEALDASLLMMAMVGFLPPEDPRIRGTIAAIEAELVVDGLVMRYRTGGSVDGLPSGEGMFLPCSFWLVDNLALQGRHDEAERLFARLVGMCNDVGLLSEEYDLDSKRLVGNFPQAFTHVALVNSARNLSATTPRPTTHQASSNRPAR